MNSIPFVPTLADYAIIISGIIVIGGALMFAIAYALVKLARFVGVKLFIGWAAIIGVIFLAVLTVLGN
jgi:hypothetical protein